MILYVTGPLGVAYWFPWISIYYLKTQITSLIVGVWVRVELVSPRKCSFFNWSMREENGDVIASRNVHVHKGHLSQPLWRPLPNPLDLVRHKLQAVHPARRCYQQQVVEGPDCLPAKLARQWRALGGNSAVVELALRPFRRWLWLVVDSWALELHRSAVLTWQFYDFILIISDQGVITFCLDHLNSINGGSRGEGEAQGASAPPLPPKQWASHLADTTCWPS